MLRLVATEVITSTTYPLLFPTTIMNVIVWFVKGSSITNVYHAVRKKWMLNCRLITKMIYHVCRILSSNMKEDNGEFVTQTQGSRGVYYVEINVRKYIAESLRKTKMIYYTVAHGPSWPKNHQVNHSEWVIKFNGLFGTADTGAHVVHTSRVIITYALETLFSLTQTTHIIQATINL